MSAANHLGMFAHTPQEDEWRELLGVTSGLTTPCRVRLPITRIGARTSAFWG